MFHLIKFIIWLAGIALITYLVLPYFGYEINMDYFKESKNACEKKVDECSRQLIKQGTQNAKCDLNCVDPKIIIQKK